MIVNFSYYIQLFLKINLFKPIPICFSNHNTAFNLLLLFNSNVFSKKNFSTYSNILKIIRDLKSFYLIQKNLESKKIIR